jgi:hypothetical protein
MEFSKKNEPLQAYPFDMTVSVRKEFVYCMEFLENIRLKYKKLMLQMSV